METIVQDIEINPEVIRRAQYRANYFVPHYLRQFLRAGESICSVGCGAGFDVDLLRQLGFDAWGFDRGNRVQVWKNLPLETQARLKLGYASELPFGQARFDFVYALEVIEHVGCENSYWKLLPDAFRIRRDFLEACLAMLKPGGRMLISTSNRLCPVDIGHGHHYHPLTETVLSKTRIPLTIPWSPKNFVLSYRDIHRLVQATRFAQKCRLKKPPVAGYLSFSRLQNPLLRSVINRYLDIINIPFFRTSFLDPLLVVMIEKT